MWSSGVVRQFSLKQIFPFTARNCTLYQPKSQKTPPKNNKYAISKTEYHDVIAGPLPLFGVFLLKQIFSFIARQFEILYSKSKTKYQIHQPKHQIHNLNC